MSIACIESEDNVRPLFISINSLANGIYYYLTKGIKMSLLKPVSEKTQIKERPRLLP